MTRVSVAAAMAAWQSAVAGIRSIPTLMVFRDGLLAFSQPGALLAAYLERLIAQGLDMDAVRAQLANQQSADV